MARKWFQFNVLRRTPLFSFSGVELLHRMQSVYSKPHCLNSIKVQAKEENKLCTRLTKTEFLQSTYTVIYLICIRLNHKQLPFLKSKLLPRISNFGSLKRNWKLPVKEVIHSYFLSLSFSLSHKHSHTHTPARAHTYTLSLSLSTQNQSHFD